MSNKEQKIAKTGWMLDNSPESKRKGKKLAHKRIRRYERDTYEER